MLVATVAVLGFPILVVSILRASGAVTSAPALLVAGIVLSLVASQVGAAAWAARGRGGDTVFGDLMVWGWLRRWRMERQVASTAALLGSEGTAGKPRAAELDVRRRERTLRRLAVALEARHPGTRGHSRRVARHAAAIAKRMGLPREQAAGIRAAAAVHDVGKIATPASILNKPGKLTDAEVAVIRRHPVVGAEMIADLGDEEMVKIVRHHHERIDGEGYPDGLRGGRIPLGARIVAVADTFDAVTSNRSYRAARSHREALGLLSAVAGTQLDPTAVRAFRGHYSGLRAVALWALVLNGPRQLLAAIAHELRLGNLRVAGAATAATVAVVAAGGVAVHSPKPAPEPGGRSQPPGASAPAQSRFVAIPQAGAGPKADSPHSGGAGAKGVGTGIAADGPARRRHTAPSLRKGPESGGNGVAQPAAETQPPGNGVRASHASRGHGHGRESTGARRPTAGGPAASSGHAHAAPPGTSRGSAGAGAVVTAVVNGVGSASAGVRASIPNAQAGTDTPSVPPPGAVGLEGG